MNAHPGGDDGVPGTVCILHLEPPENTTAWPLISLRVSEDQVDVEARVAASGVAVSRPLPEKGADLQAT